MSALAIILVAGGLIAMILGIRGVYKQLPPWNTSTTSQSKNQSQGIGPVAQL